MNQEHTRTELDEHVPDNKYMQRKKFYIPKNEILRHYGSIKKNEPILEDD